jgi:hypothetical protein
LLCEFLILKFVFPFSTIFKRYSFTRFIHPSAA